MHTLQSITITTLLLLALTSPAHAHNGKVAVPVPVHGITIDGDLSDWPEGMTRYPIVLSEGGIRPKDANDFAGSFRIGYDAEEDALYVGVEVQDESTVIDRTENASRETQDGCEIYLDVAHKEKEDSPAVQYMIWGDQRGLRDLDDVQAEVRRTEGVYRYEWRIDVGRMSKGKGDLHSGTALGFDVIVWDQDEDGSFSQMVWGRGTDKVTPKK